MRTFVSRLVVPVGSRDHLRGPANARITLLEYGDFECPHCGAAHPIVEEVRRRAGDELRFAYRHFPLTNIHPHAQHAAEAAEAAGSQRRFWPMHDRLFEHQDTLDDASLLAHAEVLGLDVARVARDLAGGVHAPRVREEFMSACAAASTAHRPSSSTKSGTTAHTTWIRSSERSCWRRTHDQSRRIPRWEHRVA
jgi:thioredoxin family protein